MNDQTPDRYVTFMGLDCDGKATKMMGTLAVHMATSQSRWVGYFQQKLEERARMGNDDLHFIGSQINALYAFFEELDDAEGMALLEHLEEHCC